MGTDPSTDAEEVSAWERVFANESRVAEEEAPTPAGVDPESAAGAETGRGADTDRDAESLEEVGLSGVTEEPGSAPRRRPPLWVNVAAPILVVLLVVASVVAVVEYRRADRLSHTEAVRRDIALTSAAFSQALLSYDYSNLGAARDAVLRMSTDTFAQNYTTAFTNGLSAAITQLQAKSTATVRRVFVSDVNGTSADAVVTLDSEVHSSAGVRQVVGSYLDLALVRQSGRWKINQVTSVAASSDNLTPPGGTPAAGTPASPSTTAPKAPGG